MAILGLVRRLLNVEQILLLNLAKFELAENDWTSVSVMD